MLSDSSKCLRCLQINLRHSRVASLNLSKLILDMKIDIVLIQEPYPKTIGDSITIPYFSSNYQIFHDLSQGELYFGSAILVKKGIKVSPIPDVSENHITGVRIDSEQGSCNFLSVYCRPSRSVDRALECLGCLPKSFFERTVAALDSNAHNTLWNSRYTDDRGETLEAFILNHDLSIKNSGASPLALNTTYVDVTLAGDSLRVNNWRYLADESLSDHPYIFFEVASTVNATESRRKGIPKWKHVFRGAFLESLASKVKPLCTAKLRTKKEIDEVVQKLTCIIVSSARNNSQDNPPFKANDIDWWEPYLYGLRHRLRSLRRELGRYPTEENKIAYREARRRYQFEIRKTKREFFKQFCSNLDGKGVYKILKGTTDCENDDTIPKSLKTDNEVLTDRVQIIDALLKNFFPEPEANGDKQLEIVNSVERNLACESISDTPMFTENELAQAVEDLKSKASPGIDGIGVEYIKHSMEVLMPVLLNVFNSCIRLHYFPEKWKIAKVCILRKPKKESYDVPKSFRPISIPNSFGKLLECLLHRRLKWFAREHNWISNGQHGFIEGRSTESACHTLISQVEKGFAKRAYTGAMFLDIASAFDKAWSPAIIRSLLIRGCPTYLAKIVANYLKNRKAEFRKGKERMTRDVKLGCPQGGVLSPFLWNVLIDDIIKTSFQFSYRIIAYADDLVLLVTDHDPSMVKQYLQIMCDTIIGKLKDISLDVNADKCVLMLFTRRIRKEFNMYITVNNKSIKPVESTSYLGFIIDKSLSWKAHVEQRCKLAANLVHTLRRFLRLSWGVNTRNLKLVYKTVFVPTLLYGCSVWAGALRYKWCVRKLRSTQSRMIRCITRGFKKTYSLALLVIANEIPIDLQCLHLTSASFFRLNGDPFSSTSLTIISPLLEKIPKVKYDVPSRWHDRNDPPWLLKVKEKPNASLTIYTDGSKNENGVGAGAYTVSTSSNESLSWKLPSYTSVLQAELAAILLSLKRVLSNSNCNYTNVTIISDSKAALSHLMDSRQKICNIAHEIKTLIASLNLGVTFEWVRSHSDCYGNNMADGLAKQAANSEGMDVYSKISLCQKEAREMINCIIKEKWSAEWTHAKSGDLTREFFPLPHNASVISDSYVHHEITQTITGHSLLNYHLSKIKLVTSPACQCGYPEEDVKHFVFTCPMFDRLRLVLKSSFTRLKLPFPCPLSELSATRDSWAAFVEFVLQTKRLGLANSSIIQNC